MDLDIRVIPRAGRSGFAGVRGGVLVVKLAAAPVDGAANDELIDLLATTLAIPRRDIALVSGARSRTKRIRIAGLDADVVLARLVPPAGGGKIKLVR